MRLPVSIFLLAATIYAQMLVPIIGDQTRGGALPAVINPFCQGLGANGGTTAAIVTTSANFIAVGTNSYAGGTLTDSLANTWIALTSYGSSPIMKIYYAENPTVGAAHTFTFSNAGSFSGVCVIPLSNMATSSAFDAGTDAGAAPNNTACQAGSITPSAGVKVVIAIAGSNTAGAAFTINSSYVLDGTYNLSGGNFGGNGLAHLIQTPNGAATNPTWTVPGTSVCAIAAFKAQ